VLPEGTLSAKGAAVASHESITDWIGKVKLGDPLAAEGLWQRYYPKLVRLCRKKLLEHPRRAADEEDVALSAFDSFCQGAQRGMFPRLTDRDDLWRLLIVIAVRKSLDQIRLEGRKKRGGGRVYGESDRAGHGPRDEIWDIGQIIGDEPSAEFAAIVAEQYRALLGSIDDPAARLVALMKFEGYSEEEIAAALDCSVRTVRRKLWLVRSKCYQEGATDDGVHPQ
jgi:DNA-directed RNA polymerase specialized sigma24 family protein